MGAQRSRRALDVRWGSAALFLLAVEGLGYGVLGRGIGFYHDDWVLVDQLSAVHGFWERCRALSWLNTRPLDILLYPALFTLAGMNTLLQHAFRLFIDGACALLFYALLARLTRLPRFSLAAAALAVLIPNHEAIHFWFGIACEPWATFLVFASVLLQLEWLESGGRWRAFGAQALYLASLLLYEALAFVPLAPAAALAARASADGEDRRSAFSKAKRMALPYAPTLAAALLWQRVGTAVLLDTPNVKKAGLSPVHALKVFVKAVLCLSYYVVNGCGKAFHAAWHALTPGLWLVALAGAAAAATVYWKREEAAAADKAAAWAFGAALFIAAYAPYALTADYSPAMTGSMSRTNAGGAWAGGMLFAALALAAGRRRALVLTAVVLAFVVADWHRALIWTRAWTLESRIMAAMRAHGPELPRDAKVLLANVPDEIDGVVVFEASYDFDGALRVATGRPDLTGDILGRAPHHEKNRYVYDFHNGRLNPAAEP